MQEASSFSDPSPTRAEILERRAGFQRGCERSLVEIVELAADRHAMRKACDLDIEAFKLVGQVVRRCLALDRCVDGKDKFLDSAAGNPRL